MQFSLRTAAVFLFDSVVLVVGLTNIPDLLVRATVPFEVRESTGGLVVATVSQFYNSQDIRANDILESIDGISVRTPEALEILCDLKKQGDVVQLRVIRNGEPLILRLQLVSYYDSPRIAFVATFVGAAIWVLALMVHIQRPTDAHAFSLHWALILLAGTTLFTQASLRVEDALTLARRLILLVIYPTTASAFLDFVSRFSKERSKRLRAGVYAAYIAGIAIGLAASGRFLDVVRAPTSPHFSKFALAYDALHVVIVVLTMAILLVLIHLMARASSIEERKKLRWIAWGIGAAVVPFMFLIILPQLFFSRDLVPEEFALLFFLVPPFAFAIAIIKHHLLDIDLLVSRSISYTLLTAFVGASYVLIVLFVSSSVGGLPSERLFSIFIIILVVAILIHPARLSLQRFVDKLLFPVRALFQQVLPEELSRVQQSLSEEMLAENFARSALTFLPVRSVDVYVVEKEDCQLITHRGSAAASEDAIDIKLFAAQKTNSQGYPSDGSNPTFDVDVGFPQMLDKSNTGIVLLGADEKDKKLVAVIRLQHEKTQLEEAEIQFLRALVREAAEVYRRLRLQQEMFEERDHRRRLEAVNELKSHIVALVSHEFRTPLTSIRMFAELLQGNRRLKEQQRRKFASIIQGESERLGRHIGNVLDFAKIEKGIREYHWGQVYPQNIAQKAVEAMRYQMDSAGAKLNVKIPNSLPAIQGDADALEEALINLLSNALKYSSSRKNISLTLRKSKHTIICEVSDKGIGMAADQLKRIFDSYYRIAQATHAKPGGMGLGLAIVKHTVDAHGGRIDVKSAEGRGTTFRIILPLHSPLPLSSPRRMSYLYVSKVMMKHVGDGEHELR
ncbi:MAG: hypothetical protein HY966_03995 [Ignavibacteriales bacterium]|nr:hypothetical protein [Ignavibacteriales bacterium]